MKRSRRLVWANPYGVTASASTASASMTTTMTAPSVPSGFRRSIWSHTSTYQGRVRGNARRPIAVEPTSAAAAGLSEPDALSVADARVQEGIREIDQQVQADHERRDDQVHGLHDGVIELGERLEEEQAHARQPENRLHDHGPADVERRLESDQRDHGDHGVLERVSKHDG